MKRRLRVGAGLALVFCAATPSSALPDPAEPELGVPGAPAEVVAPGAHYAAGSFHRFMLGSEYRDLWTTPIEVPVLDIAHFASGLTPTKAGDGSLYANGELRFKIAPVDLIITAELGGFALFDVGRVFLQGESSDHWHHAEGGGLWLAFAGGQHTVSCAIAHAEGSTSVYLRGGLLF